MTKPVLHQSDLIGLDKCAYQWMLRKVEKIQVPTNTAPLVGTAVHKSAAANLTRKRDTGALMKSAEVQATAVTELQTLWDSTDVALSPDEPANPQMALGEAKDKAARLSECHHVNVAPSITPVEIEQPFRLELRDHPNDLVGTIDLVDAEGRISDNKTAAKSPTADSAHSSVQLSAYAMSVWSRNPHEHESIPVRFDYLVDLKRGPQHVRLDSSRTLVDFENVLRRVELASKMIESGVFPPTNPTNWVCQAKYCGYWNDICPFGRRGRSRI